VAARPSCSTSASVFVVVIVHGFFISDCTEKMSANSRSRCLDDCHYAEAPARHHRQAVVTTAGHGKLSRQSLTFVNVSVRSSLLEKASKAEKSQCNDASFDNSQHFSSWGARKACRSCMELGRCKWCPLTMTCQELGKACLERDGLPEDQKVKNVNECDMRPSNWADVMAAAYTETWDDKTNNRYGDASRCLHWALGFSTPPDPEMQGSLEKDIGRWGCWSALTREGLHVLLGSPPLGENIETPRVNVVDSWEVITFTPVLCSIVRAVEKSLCSVSVYGTDDWRELWKRNTMPNHQGKENIAHQLQKSVEEGPLVSFSPGAGKSGSGFARTWDNTFKVKLGVKKDRLMDEISNLLRLLKGSDGLKPLRSHLRDHPYSLLNRYFGLLKVSFGGKSSWGLLMQDATYLMDARVSKEKKKDRHLVYTRYDLKGKSRDQNEKQAEDKQFCLLNADFREREDNRLRLNSDQCTLFRTATRIDADYLDTFNIIDYSLFLGVAYREGGKPPACDETPGEPFCFEAGEYMYTMAIIDHLNDMNRWKNIESSWHRGKFVHYAGKLTDYVDGICPVEIPEPPGSSFYPVTFLVVAIVVVCLIGTRVLVKFARNSASPKLHGNVSNPNTLDTYPPSQGGHPSVCGHGPPSSGHVGSDACGHQSWSAGCPPSRCDAPSNLVMHAQHLTSQHTSLGYCAQNTGSNPPMGVGHVQNTGLSTLGPSGFHAGRADSGGSSYPQHWGSTHPAPVTHHPLQQHHLGAFVTKYTVAGQAPPSMEVPLWFPQHGGLPQSSGW